MESSVLTDVLRNIQALCGANGVIMEEAKSLLRILMPIDFVFAVLLNMMSFGGNGYIPLLFSKIMKYGFWIWFVSEWDTIINALIQSLTQAGASFGTLDAEIVGRPSDILDMGFKYASIYYETLNNITFSISNMGHIFIVWLISCLAFVGIIAAFAFIAINAFITYIEFYIVAAMLLLFIPFALLDRTTRFAENAIGFIVGCGVKMMMMGAIISLSLNETAVLGETIKPGDAGIIAYQDAFIALILAWVFAFLAVEVPAMAGAAMSGSPALTGSMAQSFAAGAGGMIGGAVGTTLGGLAKGGAFAYGAATGGESGAGAAAGAGFGGVLKAVGNSITSGIQSSKNAGRTAANTGFGNYHKQDFNNTSGSSGSSAKNDTGNPSNPGSSNYKPE